MNLPDFIKTGESENFEFKEKFDERTIEANWHSWNEDSLHSKGAIWGHNGAKLDNRVVVNYAKFEGFMEKI